MCTLWFSYKPQIHFVFCPVCAINLSPNAATGQPLSNRRVVFGQEVHLRAVARGLFFKVSAILTTPSLSIYHMQSGV